MGRRHIDDVDLRIGGELLVAAMRPDDAEAGRKALGALQRARADGADPVARELQILDEEIGDPAGAENAPTQACGHDARSLVCGHPKGLDGDG